MDKKSFGKLSLVELGLYFVEGIKEALGGDGWPHQQDAEDIPAEHVPPGGVGALKAHVNGFSLQFFRNPGHPDERIDERRRDPQQVLRPRISSSSSCRPPSGMYSRKNSPAVKKSMKPSQNPGLCVCLNLMSVRIYRMKSGTP